MVFVVIGDFVVGMASNGVRRFGEQGEYGQNRSEEIHESYTVFSLCGLLGRFGDLYGRDRDVHFVGIHINGFEQYFGRSQRNFTETGCTREKSYRALGFMRTCSASPSSNQSRGRGTCRRSRLS